MFAISRQLPPPRTARVAWVDTLKFLGIFAIYVGHLQEDAGALYPFVYTYHVPLFFFVGGFFFRAPSLKELPRYVLRQFRRLMIPYFFFEALVILKYSVHHHTLAELSQILVEGFLGRRNHVGSEWFLTGLFTVSVLFALLCCLSRSRVTAAAISFLLFAFYPQILSALHIEPLSLLWNLDSALDYTVYFALGSLLYPAVKTLSERETPLCRRLFYPLLVLSLAVTACVYYRGGAFLETLLPFLRPLRLANLLQTLVLFLFQLFLSLVLVRVPLIQRVGRNTLVCCGSETMITSILPIVFAKLGVPVVFPHPIVTVIWSAFCLAVSYMTFACFLHRFFPRAVGRKPAERTTHYFDA